jgi:hypothetical protein
MIRFVVAGVVRDVFNTIETDINRLRKVLGPIGEVKFVLVESNSTDQSVAKLEHLSHNVNDVNIVSLGTSNNSLHRTEKIAEARNAYLEFINQSEDLNKADYLVVCDFNNLNKLITTEDINQSLGLKDWDVCTANQSKRYYDIWALRHPLWSPNDCWQQLEFYRKHDLNPGVALNAAVQSRMLHIARDAEPISVDSAFGGFAIYKMGSIGKAKYSGKDSFGNPICEHVPFHQTLKENGKNIIINPNLINAGWVDHTNETRIPWKVLRMSRYPFKWVKSKVSN